MKKKSEKRQQFQFLSPIHRNLCNVTWKVPFPTPVHIQQNIQRPIKEPFHRYHSGDCAADSAATRQQSHRLKGAGFRVIIFGKVLAAHLQFPINDMILAKNRLTGSASCIHTGCIVDRGRRSKMVFRANLGP